MNQTLSLESLDRKKMERDRAGILFANVLRQVRGRLQDKDTHGTIDGMNEKINIIQNQSFFKTSTNQIEYKKILGFDMKRGEDEEMWQQ